MMNIDEHDTHTMRCKECDKELQVNNNYSIESITCGECWAKANPKDVYYGRAAHTYTQPEGWNN